jgi:hypothetical protein
MQANPGLANHGGIKLIKIPSKVVSLWIKELLLSQKTKNESPVAHKKKRNINCKRQN